ncbi:MAG: 2-amino-4-hydroxy-6-hydroxymethyldihydropteridine diphosphokinase [Culturomica sp.]|jgi:2-amino-4-hydroxy-6-hydroxymethyldihydropteridine diphosphokinase|nr:2-amino-4-hydroxy-6-hydroxymethyldihydropteridine diphosphokinase [Culturomica sp.]
MTRNKEAKLNRITVLFGSNQGERRRLIEEAVSLLIRRTGKLHLISSWYETSPWGFESDTPFLNRAAVFDTALSPHVFLEASLKTEEELGRIRPLNGHDRYTDRTIDIDLLFCNDEIVETPSLILPHPRMAERSFVLIPLVEIMPGFIHPVYGKTIRELAGDCRDTLPVTRLAQF